MSEIPTTLSAEKVTKIARYAHEANRAYCALNGDTSHPDWDSLSDDKKQATRVGVVKVIMDPDITPESSHMNWVKSMTDRGWTYGAEKDDEKKTHPCLVPFRELPIIQAVKDYVFISAVRAANEIISDE